MRFTPISKEEADKQSKKSYTLLSEGDYDFVVISATNKISKSGKDMIELVLGLYDGKENPVARIYDYLLEDFQWKIRHFCESVGLAKNYENGILDINYLVDLTGKAHIKIEKDKNGIYRDRNAVSDYIGVKQDVAIRTVSTTDESIPPFSDNDLPF